MINRQIKTIAFDADDTLWDNEIFFRNSEKEFCNLMNEYADENEIKSALYNIEINNIPIFGYGVKSFIMSMIECIGILSNKTAPYKFIEAAIEIGKRQLSEPITLLPNVANTLNQLHHHNKYSLVIATKGDLIEQKRKITLSGLSKYFDYVEIMSNKSTQDYQSLLTKIDCKPENFMMIGNSLKSDVLPIIQLGGYGVHIPYHTTWLHEEADSINHPCLYELSSINDLYTIINF